MYVLTGFAGDSADGGVQEAAPAALHGGGLPLHRPHAVADGVPALRFRADDRRRRRHPAVQPCLRRRPIQPQDGVREERNRQLLQLVFLHADVRADGVGDARCLRAVRHQLAHRPRNSDSLYVDFMLSLLRGD